MRGILEDDSHWHNTIQEASVSESAQKLRRLFAIIISISSPSNPLELWQSHRDNLTEDIMHQVQQQNPQQQMEFTEAMYNEALIRIEDLVHTMCGKGLELVGLLNVKPLRNVHNTLSTEMLREMNYNTGELQDYVIQNEPLLNQKQMAAYAQIKRSVQAQEKQLFFLDAPGGTGKTFLINLVLAKMWSEGKIAVAVATSGIAATLLPGGRTAHSTFKLPLKINPEDTPVCNISKGTGTAAVLKECQLIVWDQCTMANSKMLEALDRLLRDIRDDNRLMGGLTVLLSGDFRQTLPVVPKGTPADELKACLKASSLWKQVHRLKLTTNMRVELQGDTSAGEFSEMLLNVGNGAIPADCNGEITIPQGCGSVVDNTIDLLHNIYPNIGQRFYAPDWLQWLSERAILAPKNNSVDAMNNRVLQDLPGTAESSKSIDTIVDENQAVYYPVEFLNTLQSSGMPPHNLLLKKTNIVYPRALR
ncbi:hypothetical protein ACOMHN_017787 [Nucella lapillus]